MSVVATPPSVVFAKQVASAVSVFSCQSRSVVWFAAWHSEHTCDGVFLFMPMIVVACLASSSSGEADRVAQRAAGVVAGERRRNVLPDAGRVRRVVAAALDEVSAVANVDDVHDASVSNATSGGIQYLCDAWLNFAVVMPVHDESVPSRRVIHDSVQRPPPMRWHLRHAFASAETICFSIFQPWPLALTSEYGVSFAPIARSGIDAHLRDDRAALRVLRTVDPRRVDERVGVVAARALDARAETTVHAAPQVRRLRPCRRGAEPCRRRSSSRARSGRSRSCR